MVANICKLCGKGRDEHHEFEARVMPDGCVCNPREWGDVVSPVCARYVGDGRRYCESCEHDRECHKRE